MRKILLNVSLILGFLSFFPLAYAAENSGNSRPGDHALDQKISQNPGKDQEQLPGSNKTGE
ncbi:MAG: hypothetical protein WA705_30455 [Candidatus Ozemobacteraceae bacterium]